jgi:hypothetical protein
MQAKASWKRVVARTGGLAGSAAVGASTGSGPGRSAQAPTSRLIAIADKGSNRFILGFRSIMGIDIDEVVGHQRTLTQSRHESHHEQPW